MTAKSEGRINVTGGSVYWRSLGDGDATPILTIHGGPGFAHDLIYEPFKALANEHRIYFYDQLGSGRSDRPDDLELWKIERFVEEVSIIRKELRLEQVILYGVSWGAMVAIDYMLTNPKGVEALVLSSPCLSAPLWKADADRLRQKLPSTVQEALVKHEEANTTDSEEYKEHVKEYTKRFVCHLDPMPTFVEKLIEDSNQACYHYMWGPSEFFPTGTLKDYDRMDQLETIEVPTLFVCGREDEATPETVGLGASKIKNSQFEVIEGASHSVVLEKPDVYMAILRKFLKKA